MTKKTLAWLRFFRVVNLPTVPGDIIAGAAAVLCFSEVELDERDFFAALLASVFLYLFGLADNDIIGAATDTDRPIPEGWISMLEAKLTRASLLILALFFCLLAKSSLALFVAVALSICITSYNRSKRPLIMGLCRGLNVVLGAMAVCQPNAIGLVVVVIAALILTAYITAVTKYSEGEEHDPARKRKVGRLVGGLVWLQLAIILALAALHRICGFHSSFMGIVTLQFIMIAFLFLFKRLMPKVSAS